MLLTLVSAVYTHLTSPASSSNKNERDLSGAFIFYYLIILWDWRQRRDMKEWGLDNGKNQSIAAHRHGQTQRNGHLTDKVGKGVDTSIWHRYKYYHR
jgi:hypothetical protein